MAETKMQLVDWLDDLSVRFIINLPQEELESVERICFQVEEAQWFYEDFIRPLDPSLPSMPLKAFCLQMFKHCPLLASFPEYQHLAAFNEFLAYKTRVPVRGAILLNQAMDEVLLVRGWKKGANWSFPRGKINKDERDLDCAIREVYEETGYDVAAAGLVPEDESKAKYIEVTIREQHLKLYVFRGVSQDTPFQPRTRKEISKIEWYKLSQLPGYHKVKNNNPAMDHDETMKANKFYMVAPFLPQLKKWIALQKKNERRHVREVSHLSANPASDAPENYDTEDYDVQRHLHHAQQVYDRYAGRGRGVVNEPAPAPPLVPNTKPLLSSADAASELKKLLAVSQPEVPQVSEPNVPKPEGAENLLSMLRASGTRPPPAQQLSQISQATNENVRLGQQEPFSWQHHQASAQRLPEFTASHGLQSNVNAPPIQSNQPLPHLERPVWDYSHHNLAPVQAQYSPRSALHQQEPTSLQQSMQMQRQVQAPSHQGPAPYLRTGVPEFARETQFPDQQGRAVPAATDLPAPRLSNHALNLLNAFKGGNVPKPTSGAVHRPTASEIAKMNTPTANPGQDVKPASRPFGHYPSESRLRQALYQTISPPVEAAKPAINQATPPEAVNVAAPEVSRQNNLLSLFRKPSQPRTTSGQDDNGAKPALSDLLQGPKLAEMAATPVTSENPAGRTQRATHLEADPVELSAVTSPRVPPTKKQLFDPKDGTMKEHVAHNSGRPPSSHRSARDLSSSPLVSATVSGPTSATDFGSTRRKPRPGKSSVDAADAVPKGQDQASQGPIQILRRPETPKTSTAPAEAKVEPEPAKKSGDRRPITPPAPESSRILSGPAELTGSTPKPFQPQILRRPQQSPSAPSSPRYPQNATASPKPVAELRSTSPLDSSPLPISDVASAAPTPPIRQNSRSRAPPPTQPTLDRRSSNSVEQKQTLLSLFGKPKGTPSVTSSPLASAQQLQAASPVTSPLAQSPPPLAGFVPSQAASPGPASQKQTPSPFGPFASAASGTGVPPPPSAGEAPEETRRGSGPMSPGDRGFLLNFLEGFKGPKK